MIAKTLAPTDAPAPAPGDVKLLIGVPTYDGKVEAELAYALTGAAMELHANGVSFALHFVSGYPTPRARNHLVGLALTRGFSHLLMADADMSWPADAPLRLLRHNVDVVGAVYQNRHNGMMEIANPRPVPGGNGLQEVDMIGAGLVLLSRAWCQRMVAALGGPPFRFEHLSGADFLGEDFAAFGVWRRLGGRLYADPSFRVRHFGRFARDATLDEALAAGLPFVDRNCGIDLAPGRSDGAVPSEASASPA